MKNQQPAPDQQLQMNFTDQVLASALTRRLDGHQPMNLITGEAGKQVFLPQDVNHDESKKGDRIHMTGRMVSVDTAEDFRAMGQPIPTDAGSRAEVTGFIKRRGRIARAMGRLVNRAQVDPFVDVNITVDADEFISTGKH